MTGRGITRVLDKVAELYDKHAGRIPTPRAEPLPRRAEGGAPAAVASGRKQLNLLYGAQVTTRPPRFRFTVNDTSLVTRDYAYWVENELRERFELEGVPVAIDFRRAAREGGRSSSAAGPGAPGFSRLLADRGLRGHARDAPRRGRARDPRDGPQPALPDRDVDLTGIDATTIDGGAGRRRRARRRRRAEPRVPLGRRGAAGRRAGAQPDEGPRPETGERLSTLVRGRPVAVLSGPNMAEEVAAGLPGRDRDRERGRRARAAAPGGDQLERSSAST